MYPSSALRTFSFSNKPCRYVPKISPDSSMHPSSPSVLFRPPPPTSGIHDRSICLQRGIPRDRCQPGQCPSTPFPRTFPISCGSITSPVVPCLIAAIAKLASVRILDSKWTCPSIKPGETNCPVISIIFVPSPIFSETSPIPTMIPSFTAIFPFRSILC
jgi:hypothetical protein